MRKYYENKIAQLQITQSYTYFIFIYSEKRSYDILILNSKIIRSNSQKIYSGFSIIPRERWNSSS